MEQLGDISLTKAASHSPYSLAFLKKMFGISKPPANNILIAGSPSSFNELAAEYMEGQSVSGVQKKLLMNYENGVLRPVRQNGQFIVKPAPEQFPHLPENEHAIMQLAKKVGFDTALNALVRFESGEFGYVTKRFDYESSGKRLFIEDLASICQVHSSNKGSDALSYEWALDIAYHAAGQNKVVLIEGFRQVLFAYLVGNNDLHLKNMALLRPSNSTSTRMHRFTPVYDVLSVVPYEGYYSTDLTLSLLESEIEGEFSDAYNTYGHYTAHDFILLAEKLGIEEGPAKFVIKMIAIRTRDYSEHILALSQCPQPMKETIIHHIQSRVSRLMIGL